MIRGGAATPNKDFIKTKQYHVFHVGVACYDQARNQGGSPSLQNFSPPGKMCWAYLKTIRHSLKNWAPLRKLFATPGVTSWFRAWLWRTAWHLSFYEPIVRLLYNILVH